MKNKNKVVLLRVTEEQKEKLKEYAWQNRKSISQVIRDAVDTLELK
jgi:hypothetical protein